MGERIHVLAQQLLGKSTVEECSVAELQSLVAKYPYFAPAQFLLLEKLKRDNAPEYTAQLQKAVLYYHHPLEFEYFISSDRFETEINLDDIELPADSASPASGSFVLPAENLAVPDANPPEVLEPAPAVAETMEAEPPEEVQTAVATDLLPPPAAADTVKEEQGPVQSPVNELAFEPFHTVDYFASQGIRLSQEEITRDKFGKQLKSFTEWLKTMKRLPATEVARQLDSGTETRVHDLAEHSIHQSDVVTEAMAEVWVKQGNREKAIETYHKLGLLNPSKKAYFAALIENLKRS